MIAINHALTGALAAVGVKQPWLAVPAAFASHFVLDALPHFWIQVLDGDVRARNAKWLFKLVTRTDALLTIVGFVVLPLILQNAASWWSVLLCMLAATCPDFYWIYLFFKDGQTGEQTEKRGLVKLHKDIQWFERPWALPIDIAFFVAGIIIVGLVA
jgi:hypothetical protein